jgi:hypothetical protein
LTVGQCLHCLRGLRGSSYISESFFSLSTSIWVLARAALSSSRSDVSMAICKQHGTSAERVSGRAFEITGDTVSVRCDWLGARSRWRSECGSDESVRVCGGYNALRWANSIRIKRQARGTSHGVSTKYQQTYTRPVASTDTTTHLLLKLLNVARQRVSHRLHLALESCKLLHRALCH